MPVSARFRGRAKTLGTAVVGTIVAVAVFSGCTARHTGDVVTLAAAQEGKPYQWGGAGPSAFDCSGLVQFVFRQAGRTEPRTAQEQYDASIHLAAVQAQRGDLVFYGAPRGVYHVGIYVGGGQMIDAAHTGTKVRQEHVWPGATYGRPRA